MKVEHVTSPPFPFLSVALINPNTNPSNYSNHHNRLSLKIPPIPSLLLCRASSRFNFDDEDDVRGYRKKRVWWSDDSIDSEDDDDEGGFGVLEDSFDTSFILKVLNAFGWMVPAVAISLLLGSGGTNTFLMALVLPLAQSVISFIADTFLGNSIGSSKPKRKRAKKKPFVRARYSTKMKQDANPREVNDKYQFEGENKNKPRGRMGSSFGGWDELDRGLGYDKVPKREPIRNVNEPQLENKDKLSRRVTTRETPLLVRLLIAVFPFLGSWMKLL